MIEKGLTPPPAPVHWPQVKQRGKRAPVRGAAPVMIQKGF